MGNINAPKGSLPDSSKKLIKLFAPESHASINSILTDELIVLICEYYAVYAIGLSDHKFNWHYLMRRVFGFHYSESISPLEIKRTYIDKCSESKMFTQIYHTIISTGESSKLIMGRGYDQYGILRLCDHRYRSSLEEIIRSSKNICEIIHGADNTFIKFFNGVKNEYTLWGAGRNESGELGVAHNKNSHRFVEIKGIGKNILKVICGVFFTLILLDDGTLLACGDNNYGTLGLGDNVNRFSFCEIKGIPKNIHSIYHGDYHIIIRLTDGTLLGCGYNSTGQLGLGDYSNRNLFEEIKFVPKNISDVVCGEYYTFIKLTDGKVMSCGDNVHGQLGHGDKIDRNVFEPISGALGNVSSISCGKNHTVIVYTDGSTGQSRLMSCGTNYYGELGLGDRKDRLSFHEIKFFPTSPFDILCHCDYTLIKLNSGVLMVAGYYVTEDINTGSVKKNISDKFTIVKE